MAALSYELLRQLARSRRVQPSVRCGPVVAYRHSVPPMSSAAAAPAIASPFAVVTNATSTGSSPCAHRAERLGEPRGDRRAARAPRRPRPRAPAPPRPRAARSSPRRRRAARRRARRPARSKARRTQPSGSTNVPATGSRAPSASSSPTSGGAEPHLLGEPAGVERRRAKLLAQRLVAAPAAPALAARDVVVDDDAVADRDARHPRPDRQHLADDLVAEHARQLARDVRLADVRAADAAREHAADDLARPRDRVGELLDDHLARGQRPRHPHAARLPPNGVAAARAPTRASAARRSRAR